MVYYYYYYHDDNKPTSCVCVCQGDCRSYSYVCGVTSKESPHWESLMFLARLIPRMCHNINRYDAQSPQ